MPSTPLPSAAWRVWFSLSAVALVGGIGAAQSPAAPSLDRAIVHFEAGRVAESLIEFDNVAKLMPASAPHLWQRGIALYYAGRYRECQAQFESHRTVNPNDVENAAWHFLCVARAASIEQARASLLPVGPDARVPMREIYRMFSGAIDPDQVLAVADGRSGGQFYAHLYVGLYFEALGRKPEALEHIAAAAASRYAEVGGYMHMVARVHLATIR